MRVGVNIPLFPSQYFGILRLQIPSDWIGVKRQLMELDNSYQCVKFHKYIFVIDEVIEFHRNVSWNLNEQMND